MFIALDGKQIKWSIKKGTSRKITFKSYEKLECIAYFAKCLEW